MASLISSEQKAELVTQIENLWDTFFTTATIVKEPTTTDLGGGLFMPGYGAVDSSTVTNTPESQVFNCWLLEKNFDAEFKDEFMKSMPVGTIYLKTLSDAKAYIQNGLKTLHIEARGRKFNVLTLDRVSDFFGKEYYYFKLELIT